MAIDFLLLLLKEVTNMDCLKIVIEKKESLGELERIIKSNKLLKLDDVCNEYYYIAIEDDFIIGIACNSCGVDLEYRFADNDDIVYICIGVHLLCLDVNSRNICFCKTLPSVFIEILSDSLGCYYVVICELDLYVYKNNNQLWKIGFRDIVMDYELIDDKYIKVLTEGGEETIFSISDGNVIK